MNLYSKHTRYTDYINASHPLARGLRVFYPLDERQFSNLKDLSGRNQPAVNQGNWVTGYPVIGQLGDCVYTYSNGWSMGNSSNLDITTTFSFVAWFKLNTTPSTQSVWFIGKDTNTGRSYDFGLYRNALSQYHMIAQLNGNNVPNTAQQGANTQITVDGLWHMGVFTCDGTNGNYYLDSISDGSFTENVATLNVTTTTAYIGTRSYPSYNEPFNGFLKNIMIYDRCLTASEVKQLYLSPYCMMQNSAKARRYSYAPASNIYTATLAQGSYTLTGNNLAVKQIYTKALAQGSYSLTGNALATVLKHTATLAQGSYALTGQTLAAHTTYQRVLSQGSYALIGYNLAVKQIYTKALAQGSYSLTGNALATVLKHTATLAQGSYSLTGNTLATKRIYTGALSAGYYNLTGNPLNTGSASYTATLAQGSYALTGQTLATHTTYRSVLSQGSYALTGNAVAPKMIYTKALAQGSYSLTGNALAKVLVHNATLAQGAYALTGQTLAAHTTYRRTLAQGSYSLTGNTLSARATYNKTLAQGSYALTGNTLRSIRKTAMQTGYYSLTGFDLTAMQLGLLRQITTESRAQFVTTGRSMATLKTTGTSAAKQVTTGRSMAVIQD